MPKATEQFMQKQLVQSVPGPTHKWSLWGPREAGAKRGNVSFRPEKPQKGEWRDGGAALGPALGKPL